MLVGFVGITNAQLIDEKDVTVTLDLQPVLQLDMTTANQLEFVFDDINEYYAGITQYAATILKVSSTVSWDLYAVGRSSGATAAGFWDQQIDYGNNNTNAIDQLPLSLLELRQNTPNSGAAANAATATFLDYSSFTLVTRFNVLQTIWLMQCLLSKLSLSNSYTFVLLNLLFWIEWRKNIMHAAYSFV